MWLSVGKEGEIIIGARAFFRIKMACMFSSSPVKRQSTCKAIVAAPVSALALIVPADLW